MMGKKIRPVDLRYFVMALDHSTVLCFILLLDFLIKLVLMLCQLLLSQTEHKTE